MVAGMPAASHAAPGYTIVHPNRAKAVCKVTKALVVVILIVSAALVLTVTLGGWSKLQGLQPVDFAWSVVYLALAFYVARWKRGVLPIAAVLAILLLIVAVIAATGASGTSWFDRDSGFAPASSLFGGRGLSPDTLGVVTVLIVPAQALLILFAAQGFAQDWNVEVEVPIEESKRARYTASGPRPSDPAAA
jgi:hypothetical protein